MFRLLCVFTLGGACLAGGAAVRGAAGDRFRDWAAALEHSSCHRCGGPVVVDPATGATGGCRCGDSVLAMR